MRFPQIQGKQEYPHLGLKPVFKPPAGSMEHSSFHDHKHEVLGFTGSGRQAHLDYVNLWVKWGEVRILGQIIWLIQIHWQIISKLCTGIYTWFSLYRNSTEEVKRDPSRMHKRLEMWRDFGIHTSDVQPGKCSCLRISKTLIFLWWLSEKTLF